MVAETSEPVAVRGIRMAVVRRLLVNGQVNVEQLREKPPESSLMPQSNAPPLRVQADPRCSVTSDFSVSVNADVPEHDYPELSSWAPRGASTCHWAAT